jgi:hypothetical protein
VRAAKKILIGLAALLAVVAISWVLFLPAVVEHDLRSITGFEFKVAVLRVDPFTGRVLVRGLSASNPSDFPRPDFVVLRELDTQVELFPLLSGKHVIDNFLVNVETVELVRRHDGKTNAGVFAAAFSPPKSQNPSGPPPAPAPTTPYLVKHLHIILDQLVVADYTGAKPEVKTYALHIDRIYNNVTSARQLLVPDVMQTLRSFGLHHNIAGLLPGDFGKALATAVGDATAVGSGVENAVKKTGEGLKGFFEKLEQTPKQ